MALTYIEKGLGLHQAISDAGYKITQQRTGPHSYEWVCNPDHESAVQTIINNFDPLDFERREAKIRIVEQANASLQPLEDQYPEFEKKTWPYQKLEVEAYQADNSAPTPTIDGIAAQRGVDRINLIISISAKIAAYHSISTLYSGERQRLDDIIEGSTDIEAIRNINFVPPSV